MKNFDIVIRGRVQDFPAKAKVAARLRNKKDVMLSIKVDESNPNCLYAMDEGNKIGIINVKPLNQQSISKLLEFAKSNKKCLKAKSLKAGTLANIDATVLVNEEETLNENKNTEEVNSEETKNNNYERKIKINNFVKKGVAVGMSEEEAKKRILIMEEQYNLNEDAIASVVDYWRKPDEEVKQYIPGIDKIIYQDGVKQPFFRVLGHMVKDGLSGVRLVGSMSTGKNVFIESLASLTYQPLLEVDMQRNTEAEDFEGRDTLGYQVVDEQNIENILNEIKTFVDFEALSNDTLGIVSSNAANVAKKQIVQTVEFVKQPLTLAMEHGCWVNFNELNFAQAYVLARLHRVLDTRASLYIPSLGEVKAKEGFAFMSTMNPPKDGFIGTGYMNEAFESRLMTIQLEPTRDIRKILANKYPDAEMDEITVLNKIYKKALNAYETDGLSEAFLALRRYEAALTQKGFGTFQMAIEDHLANISCNDENNSQMMKDIIDIII